MARRDLVGVGLAHGGLSTHYLRFCSQGDRTDVPAALTIQLFTEWNMGFASWCFIDFVCCLIYTANYDVYIVHVHVLAECKWQMLILLEYFTSTYKVVCTYRYHNNNSAS